MSDKMNERILVAPREELFQGEKIAFQGVSSNQEVIESIMFAFENHVSVMRRGDAEENPSYKQPIPYVVITKGDEIFVYKRLSGGGETRLFDKWSIGVGGHMNPVEELSFSDTVEENLQRELEEELNIVSSAKSWRSVGLINDDSNEVGRVHLGILVVLTLDEKATVTVREQDQLEGSWMKKEELTTHVEKLENWSQIALEVL